MQVIKEEFIDIVLARMKRLGINRVELAERMGVKPSYVSIYLNGDRAAGDDVKERFANALGLVLHFTAEEISERHPQVA